MSKRILGVIPARTYGQMCPIARALDLVGERWSLLVARELLLGPKRFKEILAMLPEMGPNRLSQRLRRLEDDGVIRRRAIGQGSSLRAYELTDFGEQLRPVLEALALWGSRAPMDERIRPETARAELVMLGLAAAAPPALTDGRRETYEFQVGEEHFHVVLDGGPAKARSGPPQDPPTLTLSCGLATLLGLAAGDVSLESAVRDGRARVAGARGARARVFKVLSFKNVVPPVAA
jgi:DNA-binding HxlR family transcriptional regulator